jgi:hypothetical protein
VVVVSFRIHESKNNCSQSSLVGVCQVKSEAMEMTSQCQLSALVDALKQYKAQYKIETV